MILDRDNIRYCPKCGSGDLVRPITQKIVCRACDFVLYFNTATAVAGLITNEQGQLMVVVRGYEPKKGMLDLPGGFVNSGENAEEAMQREIREELGLDVTDLNYFCSQANEYLYRGFLYHTVDIVFLCQVNTLQQARAADDVAEIRWLAPTEVNLDDFGFISLQKAIRKYLATLK